MCSRGAQGLNALRMSRITLRLSQKNVSFTAPERTQNTDHEQNCIRRLEGVNHVFFHLPPPSRWVSLSAFVPLVRTTPPASPIPWRLSSTPPQLPSYALIFCSPSSSRPRGAHLLQQRHSLLRGSQTNFCVCMYTARCCNIKRLCFDGLCSAGWSFCGTVSRLKRQALSGTLNGPVNRADVRRVLRPCSRRTCLRLPERRRFVDFTRMDCVYARMKTISVGACQPHIRLC